MSRGLIGGCGGLLGGAGGGGAGGDDGGEGGGEGGEFTACPLLVLLTLQRTGSSVINLGIHCVLQCQKHGRGPSNVACEEEDGVDSMMSYICIYIVRK